MSYETKARVRDLYMSGKTYNEIAAELNMAKSTISFHCRDLAEAKRSSSKSEAKPTKLPEPAVERKIAHTISPAPYEGYRVYEYRDPDTTRVQLVHPESGHRISLSKARYVMSCHLGRMIAPSERVRHLGAPKDDSIENLILLKKGDRMPRPKKHCIICEEEFTPRRNSVETCSKTCKYILVSYAVQESVAMKNSE